LRELAHDQPFDVRPLGLLVVEIGADVSNVGIGQADDLTAVTGIGEDFLIPGEAGIENDFTTAAGPGARCASAKNPPVFECECSEACDCVGQRLLRERSS
jgi:hypothetical protein